MRVERGVDCILDDEFYLVMGGLERSPAVLGLAEDALGAVDANLSGHCSLQARCKDESVSLAVSQTMDGSEEQQGLPLETAAMLCDNTQTITTGAEKEQVRQHGGILKMRTYGQATSESNTLSIK